MLTAHHGGRRFSRQLRDGSYYAAKQEKTISFAAEPSNDPPDVAGVDTHYVSVKSTHKYPGRRHVTLAGRSG